MLNIPNLTKFYQEKTTKISFFSTSQQHREKQRARLSQFQRNKTHYTTNYSKQFLKKKNFKTDVTQPIIVTGPFWDPDLNKPNAKRLFVHNWGVSVNFKNYS